MESPEQFPLCWSCQNAAPDSSRDMVWVNSDLAIPVCKACWTGMSPAERVKLAMDWRDRHGAREAASVDALNTLIKALGEQRFADGIVNPRSSHN